MRVFEQTGAAYCQWFVDNFEECEEVLYQAFGQTCLKEIFQYGFVGGVAQCQRIKSVGGHEFVEYVGAEHHCARYPDGDAVEIVADRVLLDYLVDECKAAAFASKRSLADPGEVGVVVKAVFAEHGHHAAVFHLAVFHDEIEKQASHGRHFVERVEAVAFHHVGYPPSSFFC